MNEPAWVREARKYLELREVPGPASHPVIIGWLGAIKARWLGGDDAPWCGTALANWMLAVGVDPPPAPYRALNWLTWGERLADPMVGAVGVLRRDGGGHVTLIVGINANGDLLGLGGNQSDGVRISAFSAHSFAGFRAPVGFGRARRDLAMLPVGSADAVGGLA